MILDEMTQMQLDLHRDIPFIGVIAVLKTTVHLALIEETVIGDRHSMIMRTP